MDINEICERALQVSTADQTEAFCIEGRMRNIYIDGGKINIVTDNNWVGLGVKAVVSGKIGYFSSTIKDIVDIKKVVEHSINIARVSPQDPKFKSLPEAKPIGGSVQRIYDSNIEGIEYQDVLEMINALIGEAEQSDVKVMTGLLRLNMFRFKVMNSLGVDFVHNGTTIFMHFTAKKDNGEGVVKRFGTYLKDIDFEEAGRELREKTVLASKAQSFSGSESLEVIIHPQELAGLLRVITIAANGEYINRRMSPWMGKLGQQVAVPDLTIIDDGRLDGGLRSALADDEGVPTTRKTIIEKGILKNYFYDSYNSNIANTESTGNGFRRGIISVEDTHTRMASCSASNIVVERGGKSFEELVSEIERGILIFKFAYPQADPITGNFGLEIRNAVLIQNGSETKSIKHALLAGNMYKALANITGIGNKQYNYENFRVPYIRFRDLQIVGM